MANRRTSLGEEGAEAMVIVLGLALLGQVTVGLDAVLEAVKLRGRQDKFAQRLSGARCWPLLWRFLGARKGSEACISSFTYLPARVCDLATGLAD